MDVSHLLDDLNAAQREAVSAPPGHYLVLAGAGSGKTASYTEAGVLLQTLIHVVFILSAIGIAWVDRMTATPGKGH